MKPLEYAEDTGSLTACHDCDLLLQVPTVSSGQKALCPRCGGVLSAPAANSIERSLALAITCLLLFFPANLMPIMSLRIMGKVQSATIFEGVRYLSDYGQHGAAFLVFLAAFLGPLIKIILQLYVSLCLHFRWYPADLPLCFRAYLHLDEWGMLEVYMLGILVAVVKLMGMASVIPDGGLYCFVALLLVSTTLSATMDRELYWNEIEQGLRGTG